MENSYEMIILIITTIIMIIRIIRFIIMMIMIIRYHLIAWQEESVIVLPFNKSVGSVAVRLTRLYILVVKRGKIPKQKIFCS